MKSTLFLIGAVALAATPALAAPKAAGGVPKCFMSQAIRGHTIGDERTLYLNVDGGTVYRVDMSNNCLAGSGPTDPVTITSRGSASI